MSFEKTPKVIPSRYANQRAFYDKETIYPILDEALFCTISFIKENTPFAIPTSYVREEDTIYIHGSVGSHFLRHLGNGTEVCISVMLVDELVVAKSAFDHSVNYRSVILFGKSVIIDAYDEKYRFFRSLTEKIIPNSWNYLRPIKESEINKTTLMAFKIDEASAKIREGMPYSDDSTSPDLSLPIWSGLIPIKTERSEPIADSTSESVPLPNHLRNISKQESNN